MEMATNLRRLLGKGSMQIVSILHSAGPSGLSRKQMLEAAKQRGFSKNDTKWTLKWLKQRERIDVKHERDRKAAIPGEKSNFFYYFREDTNDGFLRLRAKALAAGVDPETVMRHDVPFEKPVDLGDKTVV
eukprot:tig00001030_g6480.t1